MNKLFILHAIIHFDAVQTLQHEDCTLTDLVSSMKLRPFFEQDLVDVESCYCVIVVHKVSLGEEDETKRESLLGAPQSVNLSRTRRHHTKPITL